MGAVQVEDSPLLRAGLADQACLGLEIAFKGAVQIDMLAADIVQHNDIVFHGADAVQLQAGRGDLHGDVRDFLLHHLVQVAVQVERFRSGEHSRADLLA